MPQISGISWVQLRFIKLPTSVAIFIFYIYLCLFIFFIPSQFSIINLKVIRLYKSWYRGEYIWQNQLSIFVRFFWCISLWSEPPQVEFFIKTSPGGKTNWHQCCQASGKRGAGHRSHLVLWCFAIKYKVLNILQWKKKFDVTLVEFFVYVFFKGHTILSIHGQLNVKGDSRREFAIWPRLFHQRKACKSNHLLDRRLISTHSPEL